jgi:uncharacterized protein
MRSTPAMPHPSETSWYAQSGADMLIRAKAVPGAKRDAIVGLLGDRLKIRVTAPPEGGRANEAIRRALATALGVSMTTVELESGPASAEKVFRVREVEASAAAARLLGVAGS